MTAKMQYTNNTQMKSLILNVMKKAGKRGKLSMKWVIFEDSQLSVCASVFDESMIVLVLIPKLII